MSYLLSRLNPVPSFPAYTGPYKVGTQEIEIPISDLPTSCPPPDADITTVSFRIFYPCEPTQPKSVYWLPSPQREYFRAYARFLSAGPRLASFLSYLPILRLVFHTTIPASQDAQLLVPPEKVGRWPVMVFSHGLGGTKNAYSHLTGSLASHGMVVVAPEHRDGSAPISYIHFTDGSHPKVVDYRSLPLKPSPKVDENRNKQLEIRLWELGLIHEALLKLDSSPKQLHNIGARTSQDPDLLSMFASALDVHAPGKISWSGHSFGAATVVQFIKSVYYHSSSPSNGYTPLYRPNLDSSIVSQVTPATPITLLDLWTLPLRSSPTSYLWSKPLPAYNSTSGSPPLAVLSEAFFKWTSNLRETKRAISPPMGDNSALETKPHIFYPISSAHLSQSDFGPLFPWATRKIFKAEDPERTMRLNVRAILESLRRSGIRVAETSALDMDFKGPDTPDLEQPKGKQTFPLAQDHNILATDRSIKGWIAIPLNDSNGFADANGHATEAKHPSEAIVHGEVLKE
ncbi:MAG: hypothetical protein ALECFALPRED_009260 [Alectoria fallacina]|uniref:Putative phospholipase n=1 Tax=Alectoria fallacina TaxID=1903189 RepID=A0A8H3J6G9_9LECA|nr:MAG: hypothetical protein ALECFALPRED_009260 [Alectoria fallacina]